mmetsp:Transcript_10730/g.14843  ORF Transcript_10730/g.14843 Transcript_10730/m.14843 type:complete len:590 (-) Transcript_10730:7016-8785(-)|eukprot:CAMPEP_0197340024 /NCGR_PEP_ID=MMETSP0892-20130614/45098_1 /TAXON_ID=44058 ORGANISM="Aureoumbra lagunensis, Strain CCMP1510" /NCGR_SAMPLE_ID=MMETSP0892 /ASSEMBLY_ACC=CAM_ASM_000538 /LENGTH=589 /DNA_ID=CAMNT_0042844589 /DNA_START=40 /DNA_END=1809 /DNA_ORIENTATION=-
MSVLLVLLLIKILALVHSLQVQVEVDGNPVIVAFGVEDDLKEIADEWTKSNPDIYSGAGCEGSKQCIANVLVEAMRSESGEFGQLLLTHKSNNEWPSADETTLKHWILLAVEQCKLIGTIDLSVSAGNLEQISALCHMTAENSGESKSAMAAVWLAAACLKLEPKRMHAAKFGLLAATEIAAVLWTARFASHLARFKRPVKGPSVVPIEPIGPLRAMGIVRLDDEFEFGTVQYGALHDASLEFYGEQFRWILEHGSRGCLVSNSTLALAAQGYELLANTAKRQRQSSPFVGHLNLVELAAATHLDTDDPSINAALQLYGRLVCLAPQSLVCESALEESTKSKAGIATRDFVARGVAVVDDVLTPDALSSVRDFVLGSTVFTRTYIQGYLGAFWADGFGASPIVQTIAHDLQSAFPELLKDKVLRQAWAYVYARRNDHDANSSHPNGIDAHADDADVSVNLWITPDSANLARSNHLGGLVIYQTKPPADWSFSQANTNSPAIYNLLAKDLADDDSKKRIPSENSPHAIVVPYKCNRVTLLDGFRFHQTDALDFKPGFKEHRINLTFLFRRPDRPSMRRARSVTAAVQSVI